MDFYEIDICGRKELLPILRLDTNVKIAFFNLHGNQDLTEFCAEKLAEKVAGCDIIITAESKGLQLGHCVARNLGQKLYAVARKSKKLYMQDGISAVVQSITTEEQQTLYLSRHDADLLKGKRVAVIDDVISTGGSLSGLEDLVRQSGGIIYRKAAILAEGGAANREDILFLQTIPLL